MNLGFVGFNIYFNCSFRKSVISASPNVKQPLLFRLQYLFAFLLNTQRPAYAPWKYIEGARPPWFEVGQQQDCSEFLKYMLDQLLEQEKTKIRDKGEEMSKTSVPQTDNSVETLIERMFGVKLLITNQCLSCKTKSVHTETFLDIPLPFPEKPDASHKKKLKSPMKEAHMAGGGSPRKSRSPPKDLGKEESSETLVLEDLMKHFLNPEYLQGDNQYDCEKCGGKKDAVRTQSIIQTPNYLILTLLRFSFSVKTMSRTKVFTDVRYPRKLKIQLHEDSEIKNRKSGLSSVHQQPSETFVLNSVVVHSGISSECGHYYTYARNGTPSNHRHDKPEGDIVDDAQWYLFNDARVTKTSYESFSQVTKRFSQDTAYVLFYQKVGTSGHSTDSSLASEKLIQLRKDLQDAVAKDNVLYLQVRH